MCGFQILKMSFSHFSISVRMKVSVIIPVYGTEKFIARCAESLMKQTLGDVEFIFVNDCTKDSSIEVLQSVLDRCPERKHQVKIVSHEANNGLPAARNTGLAIASGEYVYHCDSDDYLETDMLECLYDAAVSNEADFVWSDYFLNHEHCEHPMKQPSYDTPIDTLKGMLVGAMKYNVWNKLIRRKIYNVNGISFPEGNTMGEDMTIMMLMPYVKKVAYVQRALYHYVRYNANAITMQYTDAHLKALRFNVQRVTDYLANMYGDSLSLELACMKLESKWAFLFDRDLKKKYNLWHEWFPEVNEYILKNKYVCARIRFVEWAAWKKQYWLVWLHYWLVIRFAYSIIYR